MIGHVYTLCRGLPMLLAMSTFGVVVDAGSAAAPDPARLERQAVELLESGRSEEAAPILQRLVEDSPTSPRLQALLGAAHYMNRRYLAAADALGTAIDLGQRDLRTYYFLCSARWEIGELAEAERICLEGIEALGPQIPLAHLLGRLCLWQARYPEAIGWLEKAASGGASTVDLWFDLAGALEGADRLPEALKALYRAVEMAPEHYQVRYRLARLSAATGDHREAERQFALYRRLLEQDQQRTLEEGRLRAQVDLGVELIRQGRAEAALNHLEVLPRTIDVLLALAEAWQRLGDRASALSALEEAVALDPGRSDLRARLAAARLGGDAGQ